MCRIWGLRLHLLCSLHQPPASFALTGATIDARQVLRDILAELVVALDDAGK